jgi:hypothetical protein
VLNWHRVNNAARRRRIVEHGLPTAAAGRFVASADRPPPWTTLRGAVHASLNEWKVVQ